MTPKPAVAGQLKTSSQTSAFPQSNAMVLLIGSIIATVIVSILYTATVVPISQDTLYPQSPESKIPSHFYTTFRNDSATLSEAPFPPEIVHYHSLGSLTKQVWTPDKPVAANTLGTNFPSVMSNTFVTKWPALSSTDPAHKWDLHSQQWRERIAEIISGVYVGETPYYGPLWRVNRPLLKTYKNLTWDNPFQIQKKSKDELFGKTLQSGLRSTSLNVDQFVYYTGGLNSPNIASDVIPHEEFLPSPAERLVNVWVGEKGVVTHLHIDSYENWFVQIQGTKKFLLFPPQHSDNFYLYPFQHPSNGQSQIFPVNSPNPADVNNGVFNNVTRLEGYEVIVSPGDVLYLPPNWGHQVYTLEPSISLNFWSQSAQTAAYNKALALFTSNVIHEWSHPQRLLASAYIIIFLLNHPSVRAGMKVYPPNFNMTNSNASVDSWLYPNRDDFNPYNLTTVFQSRYQSTFKYNETTGLPLGEQGMQFYYSFLNGQVPANLKTMHKNMLFNNTDANNQYIDHYMSRYIDSRYKNGFLQGIYTIHNNTENFVFLGTNYPQDKISNVCSTNGLSLTIPDMSPEKLFKIYQGAGLIFKTSFYSRTETDLDSDTIPHWAYVEMLYTLVKDQMIPELIKIPPNTRPISITNLIESMAYWASPPNGENLPHNIFCLKSLKPEISNVFPV